MPKSGAPSKDKGAKGGGVSSSPSTSGNTDSFLFDIVNQL